MFGNVWSIVSQAFEDLDHFRDFLFRQERDLQRDLSAAIRNESLMVFRYQDKNHHDEREKSNDELQPRKTRRIERVAGYAGPDGVCTDPRDDEQRDGVRQPRPADRSGKTFNTCLRLGRFANAVCL